MRRIAFAIVFAVMVEVCWGQCRMANWWGAFDDKGWVKCDSSEEYLRGLYRNNNWGDRDGILLIEEGKCCRAPSPNQVRPSTCQNANWWSVLDSNHKWALCPTGYFMQGLYRNDRGKEWLHYIEEGRCCKPNNLPNSYAHCYDEDVAVSFDNKGLSECIQDYFMVGFYKAGCDKLNCIDTFKCCRMYDGCRMANWWGSFDRKGWVKCDSPTQYLTGFWRNNNSQGDDKIKLLEEGRCCSAPAPNANTPSTCRTANWWGVLDSTNRWALCPTGYFLQGLYRNTGEWLHYIEEGRCCKPTALPSSYDTCYDENVGKSFDNKGLSKCRDGYFMVGFYKGGCDKLYCIEKFRCCKMYVDVNECLTTRPCKNGAACVNLVASYRCDCTKGFTGKNCDSDINECSDANLCKNGATCVNLQGSYRCDCATGYTGNNCDTDLNECSDANLCKNGATCVNLQGNYRCDCATGYTGNNCQTDINECSDANLCKNGATCVNLQGSYRCDCATGYTGNNCGTDINECSDANLCKNGATCVNLDGSYRCNCASGYTGNNCQTDINECSDANLCKNGATCVNLDGSYRCDCASGYTGNNCETDINECSDANLCKNGATCVNLDGSYRCDCASGYTGNNCETDINECSDATLCKNGATCVNLDGSYRCDCATGFTGNNCETDINECSDVNLCKNGATCVNLDGSYRCDCASGYTGNSCDSDINECSDANLCKNGATCVNLDGSYRCDCASGYTGNNCETDINECSDANLCKNGATCVNLDGSYRCNCVSGYEGNNCETATVSLPTGPVVDECED